MFTVSDNATAVIREIVRGPNVPQGAGLRISADGDQSSLQVAVSSGPQPGDIVYEAGADVQLFIAEDAGQYLEDKTMDARQDAAGRTQLVIDSLQR